MNPALPPTPPPAPPAAPKVAAWVPTPAARPAQPAVIPAVRPIFIVASLPRTGTTTLCWMAQRVGLKSMHIMEGQMSTFLDQGYEFFADTPFYSPEFLTGVLAMARRPVKVIYADRPMEDVQRSIRNAGFGDWAKGSVWGSLNKLALHDKLCWRHIHSGTYLTEHKESIRNVCAAYGTEMLEYRFDQGWGPFCAFVGSKVVPEEGIQVLNRSGTE